MKWPRNYHARSVENVWMRRRPTSNCAVLNLVSCVQLASQDVLGYESREYSGSVTDRNSSVG
jgi:hypothetical protein